MKKEDRFTHKATRYILSLPKDTQFTVMEIVKHFNVPADRKENDACNLRYYMQNIIMAGGVRKIPHGKYVVTGKKIEIDKKPLPRPRPKKEAKPPKPIKMIVYRGEIYADRQAFADAFKFDIKKWASLTQREEYKRHPIFETANKKNADYYAKYYKGV